MNKSKKHADYLSEKTQPVPTVSDSPKGDNNSVQTDAKEQKEIEDLDAYTPPPTRRGFQDENGFHDC